jgi:hypothetical protein
VKWACGSSGASRVAAAAMDARDMPSTSGAHAASSLPKHHRAANHTQITATATGTTSSARLHTGPRSKLAIWSDTGQFPVLSFQFGAGNSRNGGRVPAEN